MIHDISLSISATLTIWPGDPAVRISRLSDLDKGDQVTVSEICMGAHSGTHIDAPAHFIPGGKTIDKIDPAILVGRALVVDVGDAEVISAEVLDGLAIPSSVERLLFRTSNSRFWRQGTTAFQENFVALDKGGAQWLASRMIRLVGVDYLSVAPFAEPDSIHTIMLARNIVVVEGLDLSAIVAGIYHFVCLPLKITGCEAAPARALLIDEPD